MKLKDLAVLSPDKKRKAVASLVTASLGKPNGRTTGVDAKLAAFERKYDMKTTAMLVAFKAGRLEDTPDIAQWLIFAQGWRG